VRRLSSGFFTGTAAAFFVGTFAVGAPTIGLKATDDPEFCVSCHTMKHLLAETVQSRHYTNAVGVRVGCPDCHVPYDTASYLRVKLLAAKDVFFELVRPAKTPEEYERIRPRLVKTVRADFLRNDSAACKKCHGFDHFDVTIRAHQRAIEDKTTCVACHYNLVHGEMPWPEMEQTLEHEVQAEATGDG